MLPYCVVLWLHQAGLLAEKELSQVAEEAVVGLSGSSGGRKGSGARRSSSKKRPLASHAEEEEGDTRDGDREDGGRAVKGNGRKKARGAVKSETVSSSSSTNTATANGRKKR